MLIPFSFPDIGRNELLLFADMYMYESRAAGWKWEKTIEIVLSWMHSDSS